MNRYLIVLITSALLSGNANAQKPMKLLCNLQGGEQETISLRGENYKEYGYSTDKKHSFEFFEHWYTDQLAYMWVMRDYSGEGEPNAGKVITREVFWVSRYDLSVERRVSSDLQSGVEESYGQCQIAPERVI